MELFGRCSPVEPFLNEIRSFDSPNPEALPQRSNFDISDELSEARQINRKLYGRLKDRYRKETLFHGYEKILGIYFFYSITDGRPQFYYIGIGDNLSERFKDHLRRLDFIFYSLAFPHNYVLYYRDAIRFYAEGKYASHRPEYDRQFDAVKTVGIQYIAWISSAQNVNWYEMETYFIATFKPPVNDRKKTESPKPQFHEDYSEINKYFLDNYT
jgi:hypothetical protein